jgi:transcriptional regulator with XRE-family HTH domain
MAVTRKKLKVIGTKTYIDQQTGEICEMNVMNIEDRDANFHKIWLGHIIQALDMIGNQKIKVLNFLMENLNSENQLVMTQRKIAQKSGISYSTVAETMKALQEADFLVKINSGAYQINPDVLFKGGKSARLNVLLQYHSFGKEAAATTTKKAGEGPTLEQLEEQGQQTIFDAQQAAEEITAASEEQAAAVETCKICGAELVERTRRDDGKKFMGCPNWKDSAHNVAKSKGA